MRKLLRKLKDNGAGAKSHKQNGSVTQANVHDPSDDSAKYPVDPADPTHNTRPAHDPNRRETPSPVDPQDEVGTFSGFNDWLGSFESTPQGHGATELPVQPVHVVWLTMEGFPRDDYINLTLKGVKRPSHAQTSIVGIHGPWYMTLKQVIQFLEANGFEAPVSAKHDSLALPNWSAEKAAPKEFQIIAVAGQSSYDIESASGLLISADEPIGKFNDNLRRLKVRCQDGKVVATSFPAQLEISFNRTLRLPEQNGIVDQPSGIGHIPVSNIAGIKKKLENSGNPSLMDMARKGGVFFPMYQREAMFMSFKAARDSFAVRPFVGGVNAVSGLLWSVPLSQRQSIQDYVAVPPQKYVDGITVGQDTVRQFIAMPLGSGYSVEKQMTGKEDVGGVQLEIVPGNQWVIVPQGQQNTSPNDTPRGLNVGFVVLRWTNLSSDGSSVSNLSESATEWIQEHRPIYMQHLYGSQLNNAMPPGYRSPPSGIPPGCIPWGPGADLSMAAVYHLNITLTYTDYGHSPTKSVVWPPWWTVEDCINDLSTAGIKLMGESPNINTFKLQYEGRFLGFGTLQEQGVKDSSIIQLVKQTAAPSPVNHAYPDNFYQKFNYPLPNELPQHPQPELADDNTKSHEDLDATNQKSRFRISLHTPWSKKTSVSELSAASTGPPVPATAPPAPAMAQPYNPAQYTAPLPQSSQYPQASAMPHYRSSYPVQSYAPPSSMQYASPQQSYPQSSYPGRSTYQPSPAAYMAQEAQAISPATPSQAHDRYSSIPVPYSPADYSSPTASRPQMPTSVTLGDPYPAPEYQSPPKTDSPYFSSPPSPPAPASAMVGDSAPTPGYQPPPGSDSAYYDSTVASPQASSPPEASQYQYQYSRPSAPSSSANYGSQGTPKPQMPTSVTLGDSSPTPGYQSPDSAYYGSPTSPRPHAPASVTIGDPVPSGPPSTAGYQSPPRSDSAYYSSPSSAPSNYAPSPQTPKPKPKPIDQVGWAMGIAAGSRIRQIVHKDPFNRNAWCKARATIVSVQILNSVAFEALTGMLSPPTPITPEMYKKEGLPFFESYGDAAVSQYGNGLAGIRSVGEIDSLSGNIQFGSNFSDSTKVACTCCRHMLCDSIIRPCNHTFCSTCITHFMTYDNAVFCRICNTRASKLVGFSAPMALPGEDRVDFSDVKVITNNPMHGHVSFFGIHELNAMQDGPIGQKQEAFGVVYELD